MGARWWLLSAAVAALGLAAPAALEAQPKPAPALDYSFFKNRVEPIFLKKTPGHTRCVVCHSESNNMFKLEPLAPGATAWTEDQSRRNFEMVKTIIVPGDPENSRLTKHPLAPEAG